MAASSRLSTAELLYRCAQQMGLHPSWLTHGGVFAISINGEEQYVNITCSPLNSHISASLAKDKYLTRLILERHQMQNIPFTKPRSHEEAELFLKKHGEIIAKPVRGAGARDIHRITTAPQLQALNITQYILEKYIVGAELRYLVLNDTVIGVYRSDYGTSVEETRSLESISYSHADWDETLVASSVHIANILGLRFAAVDYLITDAGEPYILEVNTTPDLKWFHAPTSGPVIDVARKFLEAMFEQSGLLFTGASNASLEAHPREVYT